MRKIYVSVLVICVAMSVAVLMFTASGCVAAPASEEAIDGHIILNCTFDYLKVGESRRYYAKTSPAAAGYVLDWESSDESVATVDKNGVVSAVASGETHITVSAENTPYKAKMKLTVADDVVTEKDGEDALQRVVNSLENDGSVLVIGGYYPDLKIDKRVSLTGVEGAAIGDIKVNKGAELFMFSVSVYAAADTGGKACVSIDEGGSFTAVGCSFSYDDPTSESRSENAVYAPSDAISVYCRACSFSGYDTPVYLGATEGRIYLVNNDFSDALTAVEIDLRVEGTNENKNAEGKVSDNVYIGCKECVKLYYNSNSYTGSLEIPDADVVVPS